MTDGGVNDGDGLIVGVGEIAAAGRVDTTPEGPLGLNESRKALVDGRGVNDTDGLLGPVGKLQWAGHD